MEFKSGKISNKIFNLILCIILLLTSLLSCTNKDNRTAMNPIIPGDNQESVAGRHDIIANVTDKKLIENHKTDYKFI